MDYAEILIDIRKIVRSINLESKRIEKEYGVSIPQILCLNYLNNKESLQATSTELKNFLNLNASTITGIISRLEKKGFVAKLPNKKDKRVSYITITAKGAKLIENNPSLLHERLSQKLKSLPTARVDELKRAINLLVDIMGIESLDAAPLITMEDPIHQQGL